MRIKSTTSLAALALILLVAFWSYNWVVMKLVLQYIEPFAFAAMRCLFGALVLFLLLLFTGRRLAPPPLAATIFIGIFQTAGMTGVTQLALVTGGAGNTAILVYTLPFWMLLLAAGVLGEKITRTQILATAIAGTGLLLVMQPWEQSGTLVSSLLAVLSGFLWACGSIATKKLYRQHPEVELLNLTAWQMFFGSLILALAALCLHDTPIIWSDYLIFALGYNAVLATAIGWALWLFILRVLPTGVSGLSLLLVPVTSVLLAWLLLGEVPGTTQMWGIALIATGLLVVTGAFSLIKKMCSGHRPH